MSIEYKIKKSVSNISDTGKSGYIATKVSSPIVDTENLCKRISSVCSFSPADVKGVIEALVAEVENALIYGESIKLNELGILSTSISSAVMESKEDITPGKVKVNRIYFRPSKRLKQSMTTVSFVRQK